MKTMIGVLMAAAAASAQSDGREARQKLDAMKVTVDFDGVKLSDAVSYLRDLTNLNFVIDPAVLEKEGDFAVRLKLREVSVGSVLKLMLLGREISAVWREGTVLLLPRSKAGGALTMKLYDVRSLLVKLQDFPGPVAELAGSSSKPMVSAVFVLQDPQEGPVTESNLADLVKENTGGRSWEETDASISLSNGMLVVVQSAAVHKEVAQIMGLLGQYR